jgi:hypothetical protein
VPLVGYDKLLQNENKSDNKQLNSNLGHTIGDFAPHEFGYFWQYWLNHQGSDELEENELNFVDWSALKSKIYAITNLLKKDLIVKSLVYNDFIINKLAQEFPTAHFIYIKRDFYFVCQSIIESRMKQYGNEEHWWSIRPRQYKTWQKNSVEDQVAKQTVYVSKQIENQLKKVSKKRVLNLSYEDIIENQSKNLDRITSFLGINNQRSVDNSELLIKNGNIVRCSSNRIKLLNESISKAKDFYGYE